MIVTLLWFQTDGTLDMRTRWTSQTLSESCMEFLRVLWERGLVGKWPESQDVYRPVQVIP
jgi:hypothetical protein